MTIRTELATADALSRDLDRVASALAILSTAARFAVLVQSSPRQPEIRVDLPGAIDATLAAALTTVLEARQTTLQNHLTALGVT